MSRTVVGEHSHALASVQHGLTVYGHDILVALRNHGIVVGEATLNLTANDHRTAKLKAHVLVAKHYLYVCILLAQHVFQQTCGFLRQDETCLHTGSHTLVDIANQTVRVGSHHRYVVSSQVEEDTVHHRTKFVVCRAENGFLDGTLQHFRIDGHLLTTVVSRHLRILVAVYAYERIGTVLANHVYGKILLVDGELQRLLAELFQRLQQQLGRRSYFTATFCTFHFDARTHRCLAVRCGQRQLVSCQFKEHVVQDRQRILTVNHAAYSLQLRKEF